MPKHIRNISACSVSSFKYQLDKLLTTIPDISCVANYNNSLENFSHTNIHLFNGVHPVWPDTLIKGQTTTSITSTSIKYTESIKNLGYIFSSDNSDDAEMLRQIRLLYCRSNRLIRMFNKCSQNVLIEFRRSFYTTFYCAYFWTQHKKATFSKLLVAYNNVIYCSDTLTIKAQHKR